MPEYEAQPPIELDKWANNSLLASKDCTHADSPVRYRIKKIRARQPGRYTATWVEHQIYLAKTGTWVPWPTSDTSIPPIGHQKWQVFALPGVDEDEIRKELSENA